MTRFKIIGFIESELSADEIEQGLIDDDWEVEWVYPFPKEKK